MAGMGENIHAGKVVIEEPNGRTLFRRQKCSRKDNIEMDFRA
jgi:hypothetical protein